MAVAEDADRGFLSVTTPEFDGLIHWQRRGHDARLLCHAPGREGDLLTGDGITIDLPGHGLSSRWSGDAPRIWQPWQAVIDAVAAHFSVSEIAHEPLAIGDPHRLFPDLSPDRFGNYLTTAWAIVRAAHIYAPWYAASKDTAIVINATALAPEELAREHRALIRATAAKALHLARLEGGI